MNRDGVASGAIADAAADVRSLLLLRRAVVRVMRDRRRRRNTVVNRAVVHCQYGFGE